MSSSHKKIKPPRFAEAILGWLLKDDWDTPLGDFEEFFQDLTETEGRARAKAWYWGQVIKLTPVCLFEKLYWGRQMIKNYFTIGLRNLKKNKTISVINILGLSGAVACTIAVFLFLQVLNNSHKMHEKGDEIYMVAHTVEQFDRVESWGNTPLPMGPELEAKFPQIKQAVRFTSQGATVQGANSPFQEVVSFADPGFLDLLSFSLERGTRAVLSEPNSIILGADMAEKYFRGQNPMDKEIAITFSNGQQQAYVVKGVANPFAQNASLTFDFLLGFNNLTDAGVDNLEDWAQFTDATFIHVPNIDDISFINNQLQQYLAPQNAANEEWQILSYFTDSVGSPALTSWMITRRAIRAPDPWAALMMGTIAFLTLMVASFNYINISLGYASRRLTEIGVRKTAGAEKKQLVIQLLTENLILCFMALVAGLAIAWLWVIPMFNELFVEKIAMDFAGNIGFWVFIVGLLLTLALASGAYPAFYISSFQPIAIFRGREKLGSKKKLTYSLMGVQFTLALITISVGMFFFSFSNYLSSLKWGYNAEHTVVVPILNKLQYAEMRDVSLQLPGVLTVSGAQDHIGEGRDIVEIQVDGTEQRVMSYGVGPEYLQSLAINIEQGRGLEGYVADNAAQVVVVNQTFVETMDWDDAIGKSFRIDENAYSVVDVADDVLVDPALGRQLPAFYRLALEDDYRYVTIQTKAGEEQQVAGVLEQKWEAAFPEIPFTYFIQKNVFDEFYNSLRRLTRTIGYLSFFALLVSCMGLFGMATHKAARHMKEIGVRKVMGARASHVILLVNRSFLYILAVSTLIATPLCYFGIKALLTLAPTEIPISIVPFIWANLIVLGMALVALSSQIRSLVKVNPADVLRQA